MIVTCQRCETSFQLDDSRVPETGVRVRCSRCKQAFFLEHPSANTDEAIHRVAQDAARHQASGAPDATQDLTSESVQGDDARSTSGSEFEEEEEWEFSEDFPSGRDDDDDDSDRVDFDRDFDGEGTRAKSTGLELGKSYQDTAQASEDGESGDLDEEDEARAAEAADSGDSDFGSIDDYASLTEEDPQASASTESGSESSSAASGAAALEIAAEPSSQDLGDPEEWDFFSDDALDTEGMSTPFQAGGATSALDNPWEEIEERIQTQDQSGAPVAATDSGARIRISQAGALVGWTFALGLIFVGIAQGLVSSYRATAVIPATVKVGPFSVTDVKGSWVETARVGEIYVVRGRLRNTGTEARAVGGVLQAILMNSRAERLDQPAAIAGWNADGEALRMSSPEVFSASRARSARELSGAVLQPGVGIDFMAVFPELPSAAQRFEFEIVQGPVPQQAAAAWKARPSTRASDANAAAAEVEVDVEADEAFEASTGAYEPEDSAADARSELTSD